MDLFFTCPYSQKKLCQVFRLRFWPETKEKNETTVSLVTTPWPQFHILSCDGQYLLAPLKHSQAWFSFLSPCAACCWSAAPNPFIPSCCSEYKAGVLAGLQVGSPASISSATGENGTKRGGFCWETEFEESTSVTVMFVPLWGKAWSDCKL